MREILVLQVGQCGNQMGSKVLYIGCSVVPCPQPDELVSATWKTSGTRASARITGSLVPDVCFEESQPEPHLFKYYLSSMLFLRIEWKL